MAIRMLPFAALVFLVGCSTLHTDDPNAAMVGAWIGANPANHQLAHDVLRDHGVEAKLDHRGVAVKPEDVSAACRALLVDGRMKNSGLMLMVIAAAGTGRQTANGIEAMVLVPPPNDETDSAVETPEP